MENMQALNINHRQDDLLLTSSSSLKDSGYQGKNTDSQPSDSYSSSSSSSPLETCEQTPADTTHHKPIVQINHKAMRQTRQM